MGGGGKEEGTERRGMKESPGREEGTGKGRKRGETCAVRLGGQRKKEGRTGGRKGREGGRE